VSDKQIQTTLQDIYKASPLGDINTAIGNTFYGLNHRNALTPVPISKDTNGLILFTRPQLNFSTENLRAVRKMIPLLTKEPLSIQRMIRCYLDPRLNYNNKDFGCPLVDHQNAFMPLLTNHCLSLSGFPDPKLDVYTSKQGAYREQWSITDSVYENFEVSSYTATFRNMLGSPILKLFSAWEIYQSSVFQGIMLPYPDFMVMNEIDYQSRVYRLVLDTTRRWVTSIACNGACFPTTDSTGGTFNFESDKPLNNTNDQFTVNFQSIGVCYNDPIIVYEFNKVVSVFNPSMADNVYKSVMQLIPRELDTNDFNNRGYPRIDPDTMELQFYVFKEDYARIMQSANRNKTVLGIK
jgi:hypothetical protein